MIGAERLHEHAPAVLAAPGAAGHLRHQLKRALGGAEVGQVQGRVGIDHAHQRDTRKIEPLGDHLRAQQDIDLAVAKRRQGLLVAAGSLHRVGVHAQHAGIGKAGAHFGLQLLRPHAAVANAAEIAFGACHRGRDFVVAIVAQRHVALAMVRQREIAMRAADHIAAGRALDVRGKAAAIQQQNHLAAVFQRSVDGLVQLSADGAARAAILKLVAQIDRAHRRHRPIEHPPRHFDQFDTRPAAPDASFPATAWPSRAPAEFFPPPPATAQLRGRDSAEWYPA